MYINHVIRGCGFAAAMCLCIGGSFAQSARTTADEDAAITLVVEEVKPGGGAARAGLEVGDVLEAWRRSTAEDPEPDWVPFHSPFDVNHIDVVEAPCGNVELLLRRRPERFTVSVPPGRLHLVARPSLSHGETAEYLSGRNEITNDATAGLERLNALKKILADADRPIAGAWIAARGASVAGSGGQWEAALGAYEEVLRFLAGLPKESGREAHAWLLEEYGLATRRSGNPSGALSILNECVEVRRRVFGAELEMADCLARLSAATYAIGDQMEAAQLARSVLSIREQIAPESYVVAISLRTLGGILNNQGDIEGAEKALNRALAILIEIAPGSMEHGAALLNLGHTARKKDDLRLAGEYNTRAIEIYDELNAGGRGLAIALQNQGSIAMDLGDLEAAERYLTRALDIYQQTDPKNVNITFVLGNLGRVAKDVGDLALAAHYFARAAEHVEALAPNSQIMAFVLVNSGIVAADRGALAEAEASYKQAIEIYRRPGNDQSTVSNAMGSLGSVALMRGDLAAARDAFAESLRIIEQTTPDSELSAAALTSLGETERRLGNLDAATAFLEKAVSIREQKAPRSPVVADSLDGLAVVKIDAGHLKEARELLVRSLEIRNQQSPNSLGVSYGMEILGSVEEAEHDLEDARMLYRRVVDIRRRVVPDSPAVSRALYNLARVTKAVGDVDVALEYLREALEILDSERSRVGGTHWSRASFRARHVDIARDAVDLLTASGREGAAFQVLERWRSRELLTMLSEREVVFADLPSGLDLERRVLAVDYERAQSELSELSPENDAEKVEELSAELRRIRRRQEEVREEVRKASPRLAALERPEPLDVEGVLRSLDPGTVLLSYSVGEERSHLFVLSSVEGEKRRFASVTLDVGEGELAADVARFREILSVRDPQTADVVAEAGAALYTTLVQPAGRWLESADRIVISPDGPLNVLPFGALVRDGLSDGPKYLLEWKPLHVASSATVYAQLRHGASQQKVDPDRQLVAFGDPRYLGASTSEEPQLSMRSVVLRGRELAQLPATRLEVDGIGALWGESSSLYLGSAATEEAAKAIGLDTDIVHFACHGVVDDAVPLDSALVLSRPEADDEEGENGLLQAWEIIEQVRLDADLVVLSACDTGLGKEVRGEGLYGLTRAFHYAGARSVVASLWAVPDASTAVLMRRFHEGLKAGLSTDEALRQAQISLIQGPVEVPDGAGGSTTIDAAHPYAWAGFQLYGDWR